MTGLMLKQQRDPSGLVSPGLTVSLRYNEAYGMHICSQAGVLQATQHGGHA